MGFGLQHFDQPDNKKQKKGKNSSKKLQKTSQSQTIKTDEQQDQQLLTYYKQLIEGLVKENPLMSDRLAIKLILSRSNKATLTNNRNLTLLDIDKLMSFQSTSRHNKQRRINLLKKAINQSSLQAPTNDLGPNRISQQSNNGTFQIFRLVRAAQRHLLATQQNSNNEMTNQEEVNRSFDMQ